MGGQSPVVQEAPARAKDPIFKKRIIGFAIAIAIIAFFVICPPFQGLDEAGMASIGVFVGAIVLFVTQVAPLAICSLTLMVLLPYFNIYPSLAEVWP